MDSALFLEFIHPGQMLFGFTVLLFGSAFTLSLLIASTSERRTKPQALFFRARRSKQGFIPRRLRRGNARAKRALLAELAPLCIPLIGFRTRVVKPLIGVLFVILFLLLGTVAIEFSSAATPSYTFGNFASLSEALSTHRWLLFQLPIILTMTSLLVLFVYKEKITDRHARLYRSVVMLGIAMSFASLIAIIFESML